jgi:hypothetical protein
MAESLDAAVREAARKRRVPENARCAECGFPDAKALERWGNAWRCYECANRARGKSTTEAHHVLPAKASSATINIPANLHRILSEQQIAIPQDIRAGAPKHALAFVVVLLSAVRDFGLTVVQFLGAAIQWLLRLMAWLDEKLGKGWIKELPPLFPQPEP